MAIYAAHFLLFFNRSGPPDGDQFLVFHSLQYWNAALFGMAKQWTPLMCAGLSMAGEPQIPFMSLSMAFTYAVGPLWGLRTATLVYFIVGWVGAYLYAGLYLKIAAQRFLAAALFIGNGFFFCRLGFGHFDFIPFLILPLSLWLLHRSVSWLEGDAWVKAGRIGLLTMLMGAMTSLAIDGSPVAIIHLLLWMGLYAIALCFSLRSVVPAAVFGGALGIAAILDAGYLWPMIQAQASFPRLTADRFTSVASLLWFAVLPLRGKLLPANGNGHELSVFIGPILFYVIWRYRRLIDALPGAMRQPLAIVSVVSLVLGMGSLKFFHVPVWLSLFDLLRPLPGFRSIGVTGRYWGFLALPLSLLGAGALWKYATENAPSYKTHMLLGAAVAIQLGFQAETLWVLWWNSPRYEPVSLGSQFRHGGETVDSIDTTEHQLQGQLLTPTRAIHNCYDMDDFNRPELGLGPLVKHAAQDGLSIPPLSFLHAQFSDWSSIGLQVECASNSADDCLIPKNSHLQISLRQAYHPFWHAAGCTTYAGTQGNLSVDCPYALLRRQPVEIRFDDQLSSFAAKISLQGWALWFPVCGILWLMTSLRDATASRVGRTDDQNAKRAGLLPDSSEADRVVGRRQI